MVRIVVRDGGPSREDLEGQDVDEGGVETGVVEDVLCDAEEDVDVEGERMGAPRHACDEHGEAGLERGVDPVDVDGADRGRGEDGVVDGVVVLPQVLVGVLDAMAPVEGKVAHQLHDDEGQKEFLPRRKVAGDFREDECINQWSLMFFF